VNSQNRKHKPEFKKQVNELASQALGSGADAKSAWSSLQALLGFDDLNMAYFMTLYRAKRQPSASTASLRIFEPGKTEGKGLIAYPTAIAPEVMLQHLPYVEYETLCSAQKNYRQAARRAALWLKKMQAGTGSSMTRTSYKADVTGVPADQVRIGAKGTDLFVKVPNPGKSGATMDISLVEAQILQSIHDARRGIFGEVILHDIISSETKSSLDAVWNKKSLPDPDVTYSHLVEKLPGVRRFAATSQAYLPTLDEKLDITFEREAPGGHALFAVDSLRAAYLSERRPDTAGHVLVSSVGNGEDLSSTPDDVMVGWMVEERIPIAMVTTEKTPNDLKGGQIALVQEPSGNIYVTIIEKAQAEESKQLSLFEQLGLSVRKDGQIAFFNTNMVLYNYDVLSPIVEGIVAELGEQEFLRIIAPDLVDNWKEQTDGDGQRRRYLQLEGATASTLLNLDRWYRGKTGRSLVHFVNVDRRNRTKFFSPIKSAFDFFMQFHSDLFSLDSESMRLVHRRPGFLPSVSLKHKASKDKFYQDVRNVLERFAGASILELDSLLVDGLVDARGIIFKGDVKISNRSDEQVVVADLSDKFGRVLDNVALVVSENGQAELL
jgi:hypothetical protein